MNKKTKTLTIDINKFITSKDNRQNNKDDENNGKNLNTQQRLAIISKKLNLYLLVNYK